MPKGEKMIGRLRSTDRRSSMMSASVPVTKLLFPVCCSARWGEVFAFMTCSTSSTTFCDLRRISGARSRSEICNSSGLCSKSVTSVT